MKKMGVWTPMSYSVWVWWQRTLKVQYHWQEVPQASCLLRQNMSFVVTKACLLQQNVCHDKIMFVMTKYFCRNKHIFVVTKVLSRQAYFCHDKRCVLTRGKSKLLVTKLLSQQKLCLSQFVTTKVLLWQEYFCCDKRHVLSRHTRVCCDNHIFVATKMILVAAPANDSLEWGSMSLKAMLV